MINDLSFAIKMEQEGEAYYRRQAELNKENRLYRVCLILAEEENHHAKILTHRLMSQSYELVQTDTLAEAKNVFEGKEDINPDEKKVLSQLDFYRDAAEIERQSIELYSGYLKLTTGKEEQDLFRYLIGEEEKHYETLDYLATMLLHAEEWVENPEFGLRGEY